MKLYNHNLYLYRILLFIFELLVVFLSLYLSQSSVDNLVLFLWSSLPKKFCLKFSRVSFRISVYNFFLLNNHECRVSVIDYVEFATYPWYHALSRRNAMPRSSPWHWEIVYIVHAHQIRCMYKHNAQLACYRQFLPGEF